MIRALVNISSLQALHHSNYEFLPSHNDTISIVWVTNLHKTIFSFLLPLFKVMKKINILHRFVYITKQRIKFFGFSTFICDERFIVIFTLSLIKNSNNCMSTFLLYVISFMPNRKQYPIATT